MWEQVYAYLDSLGIKSRFDMQEKIERIKLIQPTKHSHRLPYRDYNNFITITPRATRYFTIS